MNDKSWKLRRLTTLAMIVALAFVTLLLVHFPIVPGTPFLQYDPKDVMLTIGGFLFGPLPGAAMVVVVSLLELVSGVSSTSEIIGLTMNILSSCSFVCTASVIYQRRRTLSGALIGLLCGVIITTTIMLLWNYLITPLYMAGTTREQIATMLLPVFAPFNLIKGGINAGLTILLYKPVSTALRTAKLIPPVESTGKKARFPIWSIGVFVVISLAMLILVWNGAI